MTENAGFTRTLQHIPSPDDPDFALVFLLKGPQGAVQFVLHRTPPSVHRPHTPSLTYPYRDYDPVDIGYHAYAPQYAGQSPTASPCGVLETPVCYYDGSTLAARPIYATLVMLGEEALWACLEAEYARLRREEE